MRRQIAVTVRLIPVLLLAVALFGTMPPPAHSVNICGTLYTVDYWKNSNDTGLVGSCTESCSGTRTCTGTTSQYSTLIEGHCFAC